MNRREFLAGAASGLVLGRTAWAQNVPGDVKIIDKALQDAACVHFDLKA